jgi:hypothetical protein
MLGQPSFFSLGTTDRGNRGRVATSKKGLVQCCIGYFAIDDREEFPYGRA